MFGKGALIGLWTALAFAWDKYRQRRMERGLPMKQGSDGVYRPSDWTLLVNTAGRVFVRAVFLFMYAWWAFLLFGYFVMGKEWLRQFFLWMFLGGAWPQ